MENQPLNPNNQTVVPPNYTPNVPPTKPADPNRVRNGILWLLSGFIILVVVALLQLLAHFANAISPILTMLNIISALGGIAGVIMIPVGIIVGIVKLASHQGV